MRFHLKSAHDDFALRVVTSREKVRITDGPFVETKEMLGSAVLIEARDMEEAIRLASLHPTTQVDAGEHLGWAMEIRPIHYFEQNEPRSDALAS
jgi:hypothetical protein